MLLESRLLLDKSVQSKTASFTIRLVVAKRKPIENEKRPGWTDFDGTLADS